MFSLSFVPFGLSTDVFSIDEDLSIFRDFYPFSISRFVIIVSVTLLTGFHII